MIILKIKKIKLLKLINILNLILEKNHTYSILENLIIKIIKNKIYFILNNIDIQIKVKLKTKITKNLNTNYLFGICMKSFLNIIKSFPECIISLKLKKNEIIIKYKNIKYWLNITKIQDYPVIKLKNKLNSFISLNKISIIELIDLIYFLINKNNNKILNSTLIILDNDNIEITSTDNYRLVYNKILLKKNLNLKKKLLIPNKTLMILYNIINKIEAELIFIKFNKEQIQFKIKNIKLLSKLINQNYPILKSKSILYENNFIINKNILQLSLKRSNVIKSTQINFTKLSIRKNLLKITNQSDKEKSEEKLIINYIGKNINIGINTNHILDLINHVKTETLQFNFSNKIDNIIILLPEKPNFKYITTPVKI